MLKNILKNILKHVRLPLQGGKFWLLILAIALLVSIVVTLLCSQDDRVTVGLCYAEPTNITNGHYRMALTQALEEKGYRVLMLDAHQDQAMQIQQLSVMADRGCDALIIEPVMASAREELLAAVEQVGLPAVLLGGDPTYWLPQGHNRVMCTDERVAFAGDALAQMVLGLPNSGDVNGDGVVSCLLLTGPQDHLADQARVQACLQALEQSGVEFMFLQQQPGDWTADSGQKRCKQLLTVYGVDAEVILCTGGDMTLGAAQAVSDGGWQLGTDMYLLGLDLQNNTADAVAQQRITAMVFRDNPWHAKQAVDMVWCLLNGQAMQPVTPGGYLVVNRENASQHK